MTASTTTTPTTTNIGPAKASTAPGWEKWNDLVCRTNKPVSDWICAAIDIAPGMRVLDIATGCGNPAIEIARRVGSSGRVVATDGFADILAAADRFAKAAGVSEQFETRVVDMNAITLDEGSFDAVTYCFALMFAPDPTTVMKSVHRVLKEGARFALSVWDEPAKNPFFTTVFGSLAAVVPPQAPPPPNAPGPFRFAPPGELARVLDAAGFTDVRIEAVPIVYEFASVDQHFEVFRDLALQNTVAALAPADVTRLRELIALAIEPFRDGDRLRIPATALCATGKKA
jgi:enediyne biosynthesis protein CalE5